MISARNAARVPGIASPRAPLLAARPPPAARAGPTLHRPPSSRLCAFILFTSTPSRTSFSRF
eukprot:918329-Pleurochrysis_carterae.AAC.1